MRIVRISSRMRTHDQSAVCRWIGVGPSRRQLCNHLRLQLLCPVVIVSRSTVEVAKVRVQIDGNRAKSRAGGVYLDSPGRCLTSL